jgi:phospholipid/cholesterol/gamma-HCH transport system substrate-binding protein
MENRSHALMAGAFTLALIAATVLLAIWLGHDKKAVVVYEIVSSESVSGLSAQSVVRFQGVPVGRVQSLALDTNKPGYVRIRIAVGPATPITDQTWAELGLQGITGQSVVELHDQGQSASRLATSVEKPGEIPLRPGLFSRFEAKGSVLLDDMDRAVAQLNRLITPENTQALSVILQNVAEVSAQLKQASSNLGPFAEQLGATTRQLGAAAQQTASMMQEARTVMNKLNAADGPLATATQSLQQISQTAARLNGRTLPAVDDMAGKVGVTARNATSVLRRVGDTPQSLLFGLPPVQPGPGESGFAGFGEKR